MMATAPTVDSPADVSASPNPQLPSSVRDADSGSPPINGISSHDEIENKHISTVEDQAYSAEASASGGSDTEASRADSTKLKDGDKGHARTGSSIKKPATFKAVSVNKTFLASKAAPPTTTSKVNDKSKTGSSTPPPGASSLSASRPRLVAKTGSGASSGPRVAGVNGGKPASAPDPNVVWNKNRPTPAPDPKKLTDEELKKYGIHVASRLDEDDTQGQNKWADLDDDDEDWAPEAITWTDGTKTTLPHTDEHPPPPGPPEPAIAKEQIETAKPKSPVPPPSTSSPYPKPTSSGLASGKGLVLKSGAASAQEKPTLVAKPSAQQQPSKSPWATLPPVEKASPAVPEPAAPNARGPLRDSFSQRGMPPQGPPPREIAADDFSRSSWREGGAHHGSRELYNSQSGRYEPVPGRRGSLRSDQPKHPAVLQRPSQHDQPAEPSSAFQTHRTSQEGHFGRRRGSSNVSGGSGSYYQRLGKGSDGHMPPPAPDFLNARRPSHAGSIESPLSPVAVPAAGPNHSRYQQPPTGYPPGPSPGTNFATPHQAGPPGQDVVPHAPAPQSVDDLEYQKKIMREKTELARKRRQEQEAAEEAARRERIQKKLDAMGPAPKKKSEMHDSPTGEEAAKPTHIQQRDQKESSQATKTDKAGHEVDQTEAHVPQDGRAPNNKLPTANEHGASHPTGPRRLSHGQESKQSATWTGSGPRPERFVSWSHGAPPPMRNVWGSPNNDRGLGNGTFDPDLGRIPGSSVPSSGKGPSPIAPPSTAPASAQGRQSQPPPPIGSRPSRYGASNPELANKWSGSVAENDKKVSAARLAERVERERQLAERGMTLEDAQPKIKDTWRPVQVGSDGTRRPLPPADPQATQAGPWQSGAENTLPKEGAAPGPGVIGSGNNSVLPSSGPGSSSQPRTSRFFPAREPRADGHPAHVSRSESPTPPPPTMEGHPAYEGNATHPHVSLPKPHPVVKLPPAAMAASQAQHQSDRAKPLAWASPTPYKDVVRAPPPHAQPRQAGGASQQNWQQKFDDLLNHGKLSPPKSMVVDPSSKNALDYTIHEDAATVSLPGRIHTLVSDVVKTAISKPMAEECFDEPEIGSLPLVKFPHKAPEAAWQPAEAQNKPLPKKFIVQAAALDPLYFSAEVVGGGHAMRIQFPGMTAPKIVTLPFAASRGRGGHGRSGPRSRGSHRSNSNKKDTSSSHENSGTSHSGRGSRGGRGSYRGRGSENWTRHASASSSLQA